MTIGSKAFRIVSSKTPFGVIPNTSCSMAIPGQRKLEVRGRYDRNQSKRALPIIAEVDFEDHVEAGAFPANVIHRASTLPDGWQKTLVNPWRLANDEAACKALVRMLKDVDCDQHAFLAWLCPALLSLALSDCGSCVVHAILEIAMGSDRKMIVSQFHGHVKDLCMSRSGHLVLSELIGRMPISSIGFVASELEGKASEVARHKFGYRVLEAIVMHGSNMQTSKLSGELVRATAELSRDPYGQNVLRHLLEHGADEYRRDVMQCLICEMRMQHQAPTRCGAKDNFTPPQMQRKGPAHRSLACAN
eukprot:CAMPEP_0169140562 /NCGR_PEP_ID=MMETSP1015-20121227/43691_1 /TAXON_ID=342587 /ORGANISM="Karlodinium micrum, Strain CCMP2283" /LENGTH=303 /DNA_ID=CAMNT_0009206587 /DNA_START=26 /DNA_END=937 /DNA_ORIENTATION=-